MLGVHHRQRLDVGQAVLDDAVLRAAQHRRRDVDADQAVFPPVAQQRNAGADADLENAPASGPTCASAAAIDAMRPRSNTAPNTMS